MLNGLQAVEQQVDDIYDAARRKGLEGSRLSVNVYKYRVA